MQLKGKSKSMKEAQNKNTESRIKTIVQKESAEKGKCS